MNDRDIHIGRARRHARRLDFRAPAEKTAIRLDKHLIGRQRWPKLLNHGRRSRLTDALSTLNLEHSYAHRATASQRDWLLGIRAVR